MFKIKPKKKQYFIHLDEGIVFESESKPVLTGTHKISVFTEKKTGDRLQIPFKKILFIRETN